MFKFKDYSDDILNTGTKIEKLNFTYQPIFLKFIKNSKSLTHTEEIIFSNGINEISKYIVNILLFKIRNDSSSDIDIKISTLYSKYSNLHEDIMTFSFKFSEDVLDLANDSIYQALGIPNKEKAFKKVGNGNIISYIQLIFQYKVLNMLTAHVNSILGVMNEEESFTEELTPEDIAMIDDLLERKRIKYIFGEQKFLEIRGVFISKSENIPKNLIKIFDYINKE